MDNAMEPPAERNDRALVTGGTGTLGRLVVPLLRDDGCKVRVLSRRSREAGEGIEFVTGDLATGEGIDAAVEGAEIIVHCAGSSKGDENKALNLVRAASRAGARHLVYISVVGADRIPVVSGVDRAMFGYFASKLAAERVVADSGLPWTTLRATQFHESFLTVARQMTRLPVIPAPAGFSFQPVDAGEVAARLAELALGTPAGLVPDMAGPRVYGMAALLRVYLQASRKHRPFVPVWLPGEAARAFRAGANLAPDRAVGLRTWEEFLADRVSSSAGPSARWTSGTRSSYFGRMRRSIVVFELNEVPWEILDDYVTARPTSALARVLARSHCYTSMTADRGHLSPWTTWPTLHRGVNDEQHMIASFGQDRSRSDRRFPPIWSLLHDARVSVGVCGTLHTYPAPEDLDSYAFYLPDAFASEPVAHPPELVDFQRFNLAMSRESARNVDTHIAKKDALGVLRHSRRLGIRPTTYAALGKQLLAERRRPAMSNRRRTYQSVLLFDIFAHQLKRSQPQFSTFFTNHLASAMHRYWAAHRPGDYERLGLGQDWVETFHDEVMWATGQAAEMVERLADHVDANPGSQLWIASSMGQRATMAETLETQLYLSHPARFLEAMGLPGKDGWQRRPAMLPQFNLVVEAEYVEPFRDALRTVRVGGQPLHFKRSDNGFFSLDFGQPNLHDRPDAVAIAGEARPIASLGLEIVEIEDRSGTTAYHVPEGVLAVYDPARPPAVNGPRPEVSVLEVAPTLLQTLGVEPPAYMARPKMLAELLPV